VVSAGDLGTTASSVDEALTTIFKITAIWNALVTIDEADVFLEERSLHDLERNAMVAVFLRQLEYFHGILFLTTNRVRVFDKAFQSRIHVSLHYPDLTVDAKKRIWTAFLIRTRRDGADCLTAEQMQDLAERDINGRQIKNIVKTASALAKSRQEKVDYSHLAEVLDIMMQFDAGNNTGRTSPIVIMNYERLRQAVPCSVQSLSLYFTILVVFGALALTRMYY